MEHLRNLLRGMAAASEVLTSPRSYQSAENGFSQDRNNLQRDVNTATTHLNKNIHEYSEQKYPSKG